MRPKFLIVCAALGFAASFIAGLIGGVFFGTILLRSIFFSLAAAAAGFGLRLLALRFLSTSDDAVLPEQPKAPGSAVDITLDEAELGDDESSLAFSFKPAAYAGAAQNSVPKNGTVAADFVLESGSFASQPQKDREPAVQPSAVSTGQNAVSAEKQAALTEKPAVSPDSSDSGILPDIETLAGDFEKPRETHSEPEIMAGAPDRRDFDGRPDSVEMVKAIRTILAKDD